MIQIKAVSKKVMDAIILSPKQADGLYWMKSGNMFVACDYTGSEPFVEEFHTLADAKAWLKHEPILTPVLLLKTEVLMLQELMDLYGADYEKTLRIDYDSWKVQLDAFDSFQIKLKKALESLGSHLDSEDYGNYEQEDVDSE